MKRTIKLKENLKQSVKNIPLIMEILSSHTLQTSKILDSTISCLLMYKI